MPATVPTRSPCSRSSHSSISNGESSRPSERIRYDGSDGRESSSSWNRIRGLSSDERAPQLFKAMSSTSSGLIFHLRATASRWLTELSILHPSHLVYSGAAVPAACFLVGIGQWVGIGRRRTGTVVCVRC